LPSLAKETSEDRPVGTLGGAVHADPFTGVATTSIPIEVPPGRNGMQPNLALTYNSANGNGWLGMGWELAQEGIDRQTQPASRSPISSKRGTWPNRLVTVHVTKKGHAVESDNG
jgi:hypothetical protein